MLELVRGIEREGRWEGKEGRRKGRKMGGTEERRKEDRLRKRGRETNVEKRDG